MNFTGYSADALVYDSGSNSWSLRPDFDPLQHLVDFAITDDDGYLDGDNFDDEVGNDTNQTAIVSDVSGNQLASGQVYDEEFIVIYPPSGGNIWVEFVEINGVHVGYLVSSALDPSVSYTQTTSNDVVNNDPSGPNPEGTAPGYNTFADVPCFAPETLIDTIRGPRRVDRIRVGDMLLTRDHGFQPVLWPGRWEVPDTMRHDERHWPVMLAASLPGVGAPSAPLRLSAQHRVMLRDPWFQLTTGDNEVLAMASALGAPQRPSPGEKLVWHHLLLPRHEIIRAGGMWVESLFSGGQVMASLPPILQIRANAALGEHGVHRNTARPCLRRWEVELFLRANAPAQLALVA